MRSSGIFCFLVLLLISGSCVYHEIREDCSLSQLSINVTQVTNASVCGAADGSITLDITGGVQPYLISLNDGPLIAFANVQALPSGIYAITAFDANQCSVHTDSIVVAVDDFDVVFDVTENSDCLGGNGAVTANVNETNGPYQFKIDGGVFTTNNHFDNLATGDHFITISDKDGCNVVTSVNVPAGNTGVSWSTDILPIMETSCSKATCHNGVSLPNDWRIYEKAKQYAFSIKVKTQERSMPFDSVLPQDQIDLIACWVDDGAPEN